MKELNVFGSDSSDLSDLSDMDDEGEIVESSELQIDFVDTNNRTQRQQNDEAPPVIGEDLPSGTLGKNHTIG